VPEDSSFEGQAGPSAYPYTAYPQAPYGPPFAAQSAPPIPNHMAWAIVSALLLFLPTGLGAIVYASQVKTKLAVGDVVGAVHDSTLAKHLCIISTVVGPVIFALYIIVASLSASSYYEYGY
jgi:hypothetical protein